MNPLKMIQAKTAMAQFEKRHPKLRGFAQTVVRDAVREGTVVEIRVTTPEGKSYVTNMKVTKEDIDLLKSSESFKTNQ